MLMEGAEPVFPLSMRCNSRPNNRFTLARIAIVLIVMILSKRSGSPRQIRILTEISSSMSIQMTA